MAKRDPYLAALGVRVAARRKSQRLTQEQLAERANLGSQYISEIERGVTNPTLLVLRSVATALGTTVARLIAGPEETDIEAAAALAGHSKQERTKALALLRLQLKPASEF